MPSRQRTAGLLWLADLAGAALFAWGLADAVAMLTQTATAHNVALPQYAALQPFATALLWPAAAMLAGGLVRAIGVALVHRYAIAGAQGAIAALRRPLFARLLGGPALSGGQISSGQAAVLAIDHPVTLENYEARFVPARLAAVIAPLAVIAIVAAASLVAAAILFVTLLPFALGMILAGTLARRVSERQLAALGRLSDLFVDRIRNLPLIRHFGAEERIARQVDAATREVAERTIAVLRAAFLSSAVLEFFSALAVALVAVYCGFSLLGLLPFPSPETLDLRAAFFALAMAPEFYLPMRRLAAAYHDKQLGEAARAELAARGLDAPEAAPAVPAPTPPFAGLEARDLEIAWPGRRIGPVGLAIGRTGLLAITGPTGSGKTSLLAAIAGQIVPAGGTITAVAPAEIAWAAQRPLLLPGSLRDNLVLARPDAGDDAIRAAVAATGLDALVAARGQDLDLPLDHRGAGLSGGERRRLGLARAILSGRPLLLCDEPTADLDDVSAAAVVQLLVQLARRHAVIVATHDARLVAAADAEVAL